MEKQVIKEVEFNGITLLAAQDKQTDKVYVGVSWVCNGIGFDKNQKDRQVKNVQSDLVLSRGCLKFDAGVFDDNNPTLAIEINYLPLWLAKISITPMMKENKPELVEKLVEYQLKAKDVLAHAFLRSEPKTQAKVMREQIKILLSQADMLVEQERRNMSLE